MLHKAGLRPDRVTEEDVRRMVDRQREVGERVKKVPHRLRRLANQVQLLVEMVRAYARREYTQAPWYAIAMAVAAVGYFLAPVDLIPDFLPVVGYVDDAVVVGMIVKVVQEELRRYSDFKGYDPTRYFE